MRNSGLDEAQAEIKIAREKYQKPQICRWHHSYGRKWRRTKESLDESERGELNIQKTKIMASATSWQIDGKTMERGTDFIFLGSKISADGDCSNKIKRCLLLGRKATTNLDSLLKSRDIADKGPSSQSYGFPSSHVWMWELDHKEGWASKNWCFWTVVLEKTLESPLDWSRRSNQSILKEISPEYSLEGLMLKLKRQYFGHLMRS